MKPFDIFKQKKDQESPETQQPSDCKKSPTEDLAQREMTDQNTDQITELNAKIQSLQQEIEELHCKLQEESQELTELETLKEQVHNFQEERKTFHIYQNLPENFRESLNSIYLEDNFQNFIACSAQKETVETLWLLAKTMIFQEELSHMDSLEEMFRFALACHNSSSETVVFHLVEGTTGEIFDTEYHLGTPNSKKAGQIQSCLFPGYALGKDKKIKQKAIVVIG